MKNIVKIISCVLLIAMLTVSFAACGSSENGPKNNEGQTKKVFDVKKLAKDIAENCEFEDQYLAAVEDPNFILTLNNIEAGLVAEENGVKQVANYVSSAYPEMVFVAKAVDDAAAEQIYLAMKKVITAYIENYTNYGPEQVEKLNTAVARTVGLYVIIAVTNNNTSAANYIDTVTK